MEMYLYWILWFLLAEVILFGIQFFLRKKKYKPFVYVILGVLKIIVGIAMAVLVLAGPLFLRPLQPLMSAFYVALFTDGIADILFTFLAKKVKNKRLLIRKIIGVTFGIIFFTYGTVNMQIVQRESITFQSEKLKHDYSFVFVADMHVGSAQSFETSKETVEKIRNEKTDFIVLGGDITDDYTTKEEMEQIYALFSDFTVPVYYIYGNHDRQKNADYAHGRQYTEEELRETITNSGIIILQDEFVQINDDLVLLGREDNSQETRKDISSLTNPNENAYLITFDHQPILNENCDLQLSGHTHAGQFFPLNIFYELFIEDSYGLYTYDDTNLFVTSGASGWRVPFRSEVNSQYVVTYLYAK